MIILCIRRLFLHSLRTSYDILLVSQYRVYAEIRCINRKSFNVQCTMYTVQCTVLSSVLYSVHCAVLSCKHIVLRMLYVSIHSIHFKPKLYAVHCTLMGYIAYACKYTRLYIYTVLYTVNILYTTI